MHNNPGIIPTESGIDSLQYLIRHKLTRSHVLQLYQLLITGEQGPSELVQVRAIIIPNAPKVGGQ